jgi:hypothetical protein
MRLFATCAGREPMRSINCQLKTAAKRRRRKTDAAEKHKPQDVDLLRTDGSDSDEAFDTWWLR